MQGKSIKSQVYDSIMEDILNGYYKANDIINERTLMEKYGVSRAPVREAMVQLCGEGIVKSFPRLGYQFLMIMPEQIWEIVEFRKIIEVGALEISFPLLTKEQISELKCLVEEAKTISKVQDVRAHWELNFKFHKTLCSFCGNSYIQKVLNEVMNVCMRIYNQYFTKLWNESRITDGSGHLLLVEAIEMGDLERAKALLIDDVESFKHEML